MITFRIITGISAILFAFICSIVSKKKSMAMMFLSIWLGVTLLTELLAAYWGYRFHFNLHIYGIMGPVIMLFSCLYFNYSNPNLRKWHVGYIVGIAGIVFAVLNMIYFQPLNTLNTNFGSLECVCMCAFSVCFFYSLYKEDKILTFTKNPDFWIAALFFVFYAGTFLIRSGIEILKSFPQHKQYSRDLYHFVFALVFIFYTGTGIVLLKFRNGK